jgi:RecA-family ATPase
MRRTSERGEGKLGGLILLVVVLAVGLAAWNVVPVYYDHYDFVDKVNEICRAPRHVTRKGGDETIMKMLMDEVEKRQLGEWIGPENFKISTTERGRTIDLYYEREAEILPGWKKNFVFEYQADQPLI